MEENKEYLTKQIITYIGNKRKLLSPIEKGLIEAKSRLNVDKLSTMDLFSGSGVVARLMKKNSHHVSANDLEMYSEAINKCYLSNPSPSLMREVKRNIDRLNSEADKGADVNGFIRELYSPVDDQNIKLGERAFYTSDNARRLDYYAQTISTLDEDIKPYLLGPLIYKASAFVNTSGVFTSFYKDKNTGIGKFGAAAGNALYRILAPITLDVPILSNFQTKHSVYRENANDLAPRVSCDLTYIDPPYNQHAYGNNYYMLNYLVNYVRPERVTRVSGIPKGWNRSKYNSKKVDTLSLMENLFENIDSRFILLSFNSEGYIHTEDLRQSMEKYGRVDEDVTQYIRFKAGLHLGHQPLYLNEHLYLLDREG